MLEAEVESVEVLAREAQGAVADVRALAASKEGLAKACVAAE